jgi:hypothetical protein
MRDIDAVDMRCGHNVLKRAKRRRHIEYCEQHQEQLFVVGKSLQVEDAPAAGRVADSNQQEATALRRR